MKQQNFSNHRQIVYRYYLTIVLPILILIIGAVRHLMQASEEQRYNASLILLGALILLGMSFTSRAFALKAQDRAIRAEEQLRYFMLTGKPIDPRITLRQIIALRFASDAELPALSARAASEQLPPDEIKKAIVNWRADWYRV